MQTFLDARTIAQETRRHGQNRAGAKSCGYAASLGQSKRVAHIPTAEAEFDNVAKSNAAVTAKQEFFEVP